MSQNGDESIREFSPYAENLPELFRDIYFHLYSNSNMPRAERLGAEMSRLIFCKICDELSSPAKAQMRVFPDEKEKDTASRIRALFEATKSRFPDVFDDYDRLYLDDRSLAFVAKKLERFEFLNAKRDAVGEAFQAFIGPGLRGEKGQFFTPRNIARLCVQILKPKARQRIIDPACGSGGFLVECISKTPSPNFESIYGMDKEKDLARICKAYTTIIGNFSSQTKKGDIYCGDSLDTDSWTPEAKKEIRDGSFDLVLTNPPFGSRISIDDPRILSRYELGHEWALVRNKKESVWVKRDELAKKQDPQILFLERCLRLLKPKGRMAIVLPDGLLGNPSDGYILTFVTRNAKILAVVSLDHVAFLPSTHTKTSVLFLEKFDKKQLTVNGDYQIFMAIAKKVGHDKNGKQTFRMDSSGAFILDSKGSKIVDDELVEISKNYLASRKAPSPRIDQALKEEDERMSFFVKFSDLQRHGLSLIPSYYDPGLKRRVNALGRSTDFDARTLGDLVKEGLISIKRGNEIGSRYYGMGNVPFIRTSDIANWEIKADPIKCVPEEIYDVYRKKQDIREGDVLFVSDGTFLIGRTAIVTKNDTRILIQSHIRAIRCLRVEILHPYLLLYLLNTRIVKDQISSKIFVQATISTVGARFMEIVLPIPSSQNKKTEIIRRVSEIMELKERARKRMDLLLDHEQGT